MKKKYYWTAEVNAFVDELYEEIFAGLRVLPDQLAAQLAAEPDPSKRRELIAAAIAPMIQKCADFPATLPAKLTIVEI